MPSQELVPFTYARNDFNTFHGTDLPEHNGLLTYEQTTAINSHYDIELNFGIHGATNGYDKSDPYGLIALPTQREYEEAARVVDGLEPGDTLFLEGYGYSEQPPEPVPDIESEHAGPLYSLFALSLEGMKQDLRKRVEQARKDYSISAWEYAHNLAALKGIRVVIADHDAFDDKALKGMTGGKSLRELATSDDEADRALADDTHRLRELAVRNTVKDWALAHLPQEETQTEGGRKPKLAVLFGAAHKDGLTEAFNDMGLGVNVNVLSKSDIKGRAAEQLGRILRETFPPVPAAPSTRNTFADRRRAYRDKKKDYFMKGPGISRNRPNRNQLRGGRFNRGKEGENPTEES